MIPDLGVLAHSFAKEFLQSYSHGLLTEPQKRGLGFSPKPLKMLIKKKIGARGFEPPTP